MVQNAQQHHPVCKFQQFRQFVQTVRIIISNTLSKCLLRQVNSLLVCTANQLQHFEPG